MKRKQPVFPEKHDYHIMGRAMDDEIKTQIENLTGRTVETVTVHTTFNHRNDIGKRYGVTVEAIFEGDEAKYGGACQWGDSSMRAELLAHATLALVKMATDVEA